MAIPIAVLPGSFDTVTGGYIEPLYWVPPMALGSALLYLLDFTRVIETGNTIVAFSVASGTLTVQSSATNATANGIDLVLTGGAAWQLYEVSVAATMADGQVKTCTFDILVSEPAVTPVPTPALAPAPTPAPNTVEPPAS